MSWDQWISQNGGTWNAYTSGEETNYHVKVQSSAFEQTADRLLDFFVHPLLKREKVADELRAVDSEYQMYFDNDERKLWMINKATCDARHNFSRFDIGNTETLQTIPSSKHIDLREELKLFHDRWYVASSMRMVVYSDQTIERMTDMFTRQLPVNQLKAGPYRQSVFNSHYFQKANLQKRIYIQTKKDIHILSILFPIRSWNWDYKQENPAGIVVNFLDYEGPGSLLSVWRRARWATSLSATESMIGYGLGEFGIEVILSQEGLKHTDEIVSDVFKYLGLIRRQLFVDGNRMFEESSLINRIQFENSETSDPLDDVKFYSTCMQSFPIQEVLLNYMNWNRFDTNLIGAVLDVLVPERVRVAILSPTVANQVNQVENYYKINYAIEDVRADTVASWTRCLKDYSASRTFQLPPPNLYIPTDFSLKKIEAANKVLPRIVTNEPHVRNWFYQDIKFRKPKSYYSIVFRSPEVIADDLSGTAWRVLLRHLDIALHEQLFQASLVGNSYALTESRLGFNFEVTGYSDKLHLMLDMLVKELQSLTAEGFELAKEAYRDALNNRAKSSLDVIGFNWLQEMLYKNNLSPEEQLDEMARVTFEVSMDVLKRSLKKPFVEGLVCGNVRSDEDVAKLIEIEADLVNHATGCVSGDLMRPDQAINLPPNKWYLYRRSMPEYQNSMVLNYYQAGMHTIEMRVRCFILTALLEARFFNEIRTVKGVGYYVYLSTYKIGTSIGLTTMALSANRNVAEIDDEIETFMQAQYAFLTNLSADDYAQKVKSLAASILDPLRNMNDQATEWNAEIQKARYELNFREEFKYWLDQITLTEVSTLYKQILIDRPSKVSIQISGKDKPLGDCVSLPTFFT